MESQPAPDSAPTAAQTPLRLLVVEDNPTNQKVILRQLQSLGYEADLVTHGQAALDQMAHTFYPIVLMDCRLPGIDGYTAARLIRQREQERLQAGHPGPGRSVIIALTASDEPQDQATAMAAGMDDFLMKPLRRETLAAALNHWQQVVSQLTVSQPTAAAGQADQALAALTATLTELQFDLEQLHQLSDHSYEFEQELLQLYLDDTQFQVQQLQEACQQQDLAAIEQIAHHLKGASASIGAKSVETLAEDLEVQAKHRDWPGTAELLTQLRRTFEQVQSQLKPVL